MSATPRSRTSSLVPSRSGTPLPRRSPSRLATPPTMRSSPSVASLRIYSHGSSVVPSPSPGSPSSRPEGGSSSSPSIAEGILVQEPDADVDIVDGDQGNASGIVESRAGNEESKKNLRDQLRRTLSKKESFAGTSFAIVSLLSCLSTGTITQMCLPSEGDTVKCRLCGRSLMLQVRDVTHSRRDMNSLPVAGKYIPRQYFVLTDAGKPVFVRWLFSSLSIWSRSNAMQ